MTTATHTRVDPQDVALLDELAELALKLEVGTDPGGIYDAALRRLHAAGYSVFPVLEVNWTGELDWNPSDALVHHARMTQAAGGCHVAAMWLFWRADQGHSWDDLRHEGGFSCPPSDIHAMRTFEEQLAVAEPAFVERVRASELTEEEISAATPLVRRFVEANRDQIPPYPANDGRS